MRIVRVERPVLWVEYEKEEVALEVGDVMVAPQGVFQVEMVIPLHSDGTILTLSDTRGDATWPEARAHISFTRTMKQVR
jgi:hypothetical protein